MHSIQLILITSLFSGEVMKRFSVLLFFFLFIFSFQAFSQTVYIIDTGTKYHTENCRQLNQSKHKIELQKALDKGFTACQVCKSGGTSVQSSTQNKTNIKSDSNTKTKSSGRCQSTTNKGTQCKRNAKADSIYCWQHQ